MPWQDAPHDDEIRRHAGLAMSIARRFAGRAELADLYQAACIGLVRAVRAYDPARGTAFTTYAAALMISEIRMYLRGQGPLHIPRPVRELAHKCRAAHSALSAELGRDPSVTEIAARLSVSPADVAFAMDSDAPIRSLDEPVYNAPDARLLMDMIPGELAWDESTLSSVMLQTALSRLPKAMQAVIAMRFFEERTQAETAALLGVSQPQVHRIEKAALAALRRSATRE